MENISKRLGALLLCVVMIAALAVPTLAAEPTVYTSDALTAGRTRQEIAQRYADAIAAGETYADGAGATYYTDPASLEAPYAAGTLTPDTHAAMTAMTNYYRWLVGAPELTEISAGSDSLQKGALVRNFDFNHIVSASNKPADMDDALWNEGAAAKHNILALGYTPRGSIRGWLNEGYSLTSGKWDTIGHRMALLSSDISDVQFGYAGQCAIGVIQARENTPSLPFTAFPAPGDMPLGDVNARASAWTAELNPAVLSCGSGGSVVVTVTNLTTGESYTCTSANGLLHPGPTLSFVQPTPANGTSYAEDESFRVTITGLTDVATGGSATVDYTVTFFDVRNYVDAVVTSCTPVDYTNMFITNQMDNEDMLQKLALVLPQSVIVQTSVGRTFTLPVSGAWEPDAENTCWRNTVDASLLPELVTDPDGVLQNVTLTWAYPRVPYYTGQLTAVGAKGAAGTNGSITLARYMTNLEFAQLYQFTLAVDGSLAAALRFDSDSPNHALASNKSTFAMEPWRASDSGEWLGVYYSKTGYWHDAYAVGMLTAEITCDHPGTELVGAKEPTHFETGYTGDLVCTECGEVLEQGTVIPMLPPELQFRAVEQGTGAVLDDPASGLQNSDGVVTADPVAPSYLGYEVVGWTVTASNGASAAVEPVDGIVTAEMLNTAIAGLLAESGCETVTVTALYARTGEYYTVVLSYTMPDGTVVDNCETAPYPVGNAAKITTSETFTDGENTYYFDHWLIDGKEYPVQSVTLRPDQPGSYAATAVYTEQPKEAVADPVLAVTNAFAETVNGTAKTGVTMIYAVPEGCTLKNASFRVSTKDPSLQESFSMATSKLTTPDGSYTVHINVNTKKDVTVYVCAVLVVTEDATGAERTYQTKPIGYVWSRL